MTRVRLIKTPERDLDEWWGIEYPDGALAESVFGPVLRRTKSEIRGLIRLGGFYKTGKPKRIQLVS